MASARLPCPVDFTVDPQDSAYDGIVLVTDSLDKLTGKLEFLKEPLQTLKTVDAAVGSDIVIAALKAGVKRPLLVRAEDNSFSEALLVSVLGAFHSLYVPIEIRDMKTDRMTKADQLGFWCPNESVGDRVKNWSEALESGRLVARDIGGSDPERMAAPKVKEYMQELFGGETSSVKVNVVDDDKILLEKYPLFSAVNRCAKHVPRHKGCVIKLEYAGQGEIEETLMLVGKGVTYDTGGADIKAGGVMAGMHRDKCGAAAVAGFFQIVNLIKPKGIKIVGTMAMVRNSVGSECYVADEIITSRAKKRVRIGNTDAEGRMAMADCLCEMKEKAIKETNPQLFTIATLTGHAVLAMGPEYSIVMDNGPARKKQCAQNLQEAGEILGDPFEISTIRREDYDFHSGKSEYEDVLQCNNLPSSKTPRGHQGPGAFLILASGLDQHGIDGEIPLRYSHLDIAGSSGPFPGVPTGAPIVALAAKYLMPK
ncbi:putative aminopeptidase W07G4.4 [Anneissia japonica]|uniref:putative aminopeptidase W07G4.4 n=1 Tax=Anneissia japonica TaxID=1529436 RepID=UPI001425AB42|nr:putative aminopeptidase W07G4.4 [Anneissia japonica]